MRISKDIFENSTERGYVAALSVLLVGAIATTVVISLLLNGIIASQQVGTEEAGVQARQLAHTCVELALQEIQLDPGYSGNEIVSPIGRGSCRYAVAGGVVATIGQVGDTRQRVEVTYATNPLVVTSWVENP